MKAPTSVHARNPLHWVQKRYLTWTAYGLLLLAATLCQFTPHFLEIGGARPMPILPLVVCIALFTGPAGGTAAGAIMGFVWDVYAGQLLGLYGLLLMAVGCASGLLAWLLVRNNILSAWLLCSAATMVYTLFAWGLTYLLMGKDQPLLVLWLYYLPDWLYTSLLSPLLYQITWLITRSIRKRE